MAPYLTGGKGNDTYIFGRGYGHDVIQDNGPKNGLFDPPSKDVLKFVNDIRWTEIDFLRVGASDDLALRLTRIEDKISISNNMPPTMASTAASLKERMDADALERRTRAAMIQSVIAQCGYSDCSRLPG